LTSNAVEGHETRCTRNGDVKRLGRLDMPRDKIQMECEGLQAVRSPGDAAGMRKAMGGPSYPARPGGRK